jgi:hypothetical protein
LNLFTGSLNSVVEGLAADDGEVALVSSLKGAFEVNGSSADCAAWVGLIALQTAGTVADINDVTDNILPDILDSVTDDVFGYQALGNIVHPRLRFETATPVATINFSLNGRLLNLLNKETETERLQSLYLIVVGSHLDQEALSFEGHYEITYRVVRKSITFR